jgi:hypothetical protein
MNVVCSMMSDRLSILLEEEPQRSYGVIENGVAVRRQMR